MGESLLAVEFFRPSLLFATAQGVDLLSTMLGMQRGMEEGNPLAPQLEPGSNDRNHRKWSLPLSAVLARR